MIYGYSNGKRYELLKRNGMKGYLYVEGWRSLVWCTFEKIEEFQMPSKPPTASQPTTRPATREEKISRPGVYEVVQRAEEAFESAKQREWQGLTNEELIDLTAIYSGAPLYCAIEAKLKEKNT